MLIKEFRGCVENKPCLYKNIYRNKIWLEKQQFSKSLLIKISSRLGGTSSMRDWTSTNVI